MKIATGYLAFSLLILSANAWADDHGKKDKTPAATVNGVVITKGELESTYAQNLLYVSNKPVTKKKVLRDLANRIIGIQRAKKNNLHKDPIVKKKMEDVLYHAQISKDLAPELKKIKVKDKDVKKYYKLYPEYRTAHILFRVRARPEEAEWKAALTKAKEVYIKLTKKPKEFAQMANKYSQSSAAPNGGDVGFQPAVRMAPQYFRAIKGKKKGYISPPVRTQFGYHIIKVLAKKSYKHINKPLYKKIVYDIKRDRILEKFFADMRKAASIKVHISLD